MVIVLIAQLLTKLKILSKNQKLINVFIIKTGMNNHAGFKTVFCKNLTEESQKDTRRNCGTDHTGHVGGHCMGEKMVGRIGLESDCLGYARRIRNCRNAGIADERVHLLAFRQEQVHELDETHAEECRDHEGNETESEDED